MSSSASRGWAAPTPSSAACSSLDDGKPEGGIPWPNGHNNGDYPCSYFGGNGRGSRNTLCRSPRRLRFQGQTRGGWQWWSAATPQECQATGGWQWWSAATPQECQATGGWQWWSAATPQERQATGGW